MKRNRFEVYFKKSTGWWYLAAKYDGLLSVETYDLKREAVAEGAREAKAHPPSELTIKTKKGRIGKGSGGRRSYGHDPRKHKG